MAMSAQNERSTVVKTRFTLRLLSLAALGSLIVAGGNCADQRPPECTSPAAGHFTVRLEQPSPSDPTCPVDTAIVVATRSFYGLDAEGAVDYELPFKVAIQTLEMGEEYANIEGNADRIADGRAPEEIIATDKLYAYGQFTTPQPDGNDQCYIPTFAPAVLNAPTLLAVEDDPTTTDEDESVPVEPSFTLRAEWSNVTFLVSTAYPGVQFTGTVTLTRRKPRPDPDPDPEAPTETCTVTYNAVAVSAVNTYDCSTPDPTDEDAPPYARTEGYNQSLCSAEPDFSQGIPFGSGINPDFPIVCDPESKLCLLDGPFRSGVKN
jgi:hypothetical protein